jgi:hypothetical protein
LASETLQEFAESRGRKLPGAWIDQLPDEVFNQCWDGTENGIGKIMITKWLHSLGYDDATQGKVAALSTRDRR